VGPERYLRDFVHGLGKTRRTLAVLPDATDNIAKLAQAWADGEIDLSPNHTTASAKPRKRGAAIALGATWAAAQL